MPVFWELLVRQPLPNLTTTKLSPSQKSLNIRYFLWKLEKQIKLLLPGWLPSIGKVSGCTLRVTASQSIKDRLSFEVKKILPFAPQHVMNLVQMNQKYRKFPFLRRESKGCERDLWVGETMMNWSCARLGHHPTIGR